MISRFFYCKYILQSCGRINTNRSYSNMESSKIVSMIQSIKNCIPALDNDLHKGQAGRIGIVGGSLEYTGAPYFAGISALKVGADLVHIFCAPSAATVIKSYSPELIVHPLLDKNIAFTEIPPWLDRLHAIVIGPGLGREHETFWVVSELIPVIKSKKIPLVIDADGLFLVTENPQLIKGFKSPVILTPNEIEYQRLCKRTGGSCDLKNLGSNITLLKKGANDELMSFVPDVQWKSNKGGSGRRCGGQGDLLSGSVATFLNWTLSNKEKIKNSSWLAVDNANPSTSIDEMAVATSLACYAASILVRRCNEEAFKIKGRSMLASDMIEHIHPAFEDIFGQ